MANPAENTQGTVTENTVSIDNTADSSVKSAKVVDDVCDVATAEGIEGVVAPVVVDKPDAGDSYSLLIQPGKEYFLDFEQSEVANMTQQNGDLTITLKDGSSIVLQNFIPATNNEDLPAEVAFRDPFALTDFDVVEVVDTVPSDEALEEPQAEVRETVEEAAAETVQEDVSVAKIEPAAGDEPSAQDLAQIEPAAGDDGGAGGRGGYGFNSSFDPSGVIGLNDVGPIGPTALRYGVNFRNPESYAQRTPQDDTPQIEVPDSVVLDETNLNGGSQSYSDTIDVDFGADSAGATIGSNGNFSVSGSLLGGNLTSNGDDITVTENAAGDGYVGTTSGGIVVFDIIIDPVTGDYTFTQYEQIDHADATDPDDRITLTFGVEAIDSEGDTANTSITVTILDDAPVLDDDSLGTIDEAGLTGGPVTVNGDLTEDSGEDTPAEITADGAFNASGDLANGATLTSNGETVTVTSTANGYVGTIPDGSGGTITVFELNITDDATGAYEFTLYQGLDHANPGDTITLGFGVEITDFDGDSDPATITVNITDDQPEIPENEVPTIGQGYEVVDESDMSPTDQVSGSVTFNVGGDAPGEFGATGNYTLPTGLTSNGEPVDVTFDPATGTYTGTADGNPVFTMVVEDNGNYTFTLEGPIDHPDATDADDVLQLTFEVEVTDADGDSDTSNIVIDVKDDGPVIADDNLGTIDEGTLNGGSVTVNGNLNEDFGADGEGEITTANIDGLTTGFQATGLTGGTLTSGGEEVIVTATPTGYVGTTTSGTVVFELNITDQSTGAYEFTLHQSLDHADDGDSNPNNDIISLNFGVEITDYDGDTDPATITVNILDDGPSIPGGDCPALGEGQETVDETDLGTPAVVQTGTVPFDYGDDGAGTFGATGGFDLNGLTSEGQPIDVTFDPATGTYTATSHGETIFTLVVEPNGDYTFELLGTVDHPDTTNHNDAVQISFDVAVSDADGDSATGQILINVLDDGPDAVNDSVTVVDLDVPVTGNVTDNDDGGADEVATVTNVNFDGTDYPVVEGTTTVITTPYGQLSINSDGSYTYQANGTNTTFLSENFTYTLTDGDGDVDTAVLCVELCDVDNTPEIKVQDLVVDETDMDPTDEDNGEIGVDFNGDGPGAFSGEGADSVELNGLTSEGQPIDVTYDAATQTYTGTSHGDTIFTFTVNTDGTYDFTLIGAVDHPNTADHNDAVQISFGVQVTDADDDVATADVNVTIYDDGPVISSPLFQAVDESNLDGGPLVVNGQLNHDFGQDGAGEISPLNTGGFQALFQMGGTPQTLTSNGVAVAVTVVGNSYVGTANGETIFTLEINPQTGEYTYTQYGTVDHPDGTNHDDVIWLKFDVQITDGDGDTDVATIGIDVRDDGPCANDDSIEFDSDAGQATGNVITNDDLSQDAPNTVTKIAFEGNEVDVPQDGTSVTINGDNGSLEIFANGDYIYTPNGGGTGAGTTATFDPSAVNVNGIQESLTLDGITVTVGNAGNFDLSWVNTADGSGIGIDNLNTGDSPKIWPAGESLDIAGEQDVQTMTITLADIGSNNNNGEYGADLIITLADGSQVTTEIQFAPGQINNGEFTFTLDSADYGQLISSVNLSSTNAGQYCAASMLLNEVEVTYPGCNTCVEDQFVYTLTDADGDSDTANLNITCTNDEVVLVVNNNADSVCVKEDGSVDVPVSAQYSGGDGDEIMTLTLEGVDPNWDVTANGWTDNGDGTFSLTLAAGVTNYNGTFTFEPPADSDIDMTGLNVTASVYDPDTATSEIANDSFDIHVDAVIDAPTLSVQNFTTYSWHKDYAHQVDLSISAAVTDTDGSEEITKIQIDLNNMFTNGAGEYTTLASMGVTLNMGTEIEPGVWEIPVNAGDTSAALDGLQMLVPAGGEEFWGIHQWYTGGHAASVTVTAFAEEVNLGGQECDLSDNATEIEATICFDFYITPLVLDLDGDGVELISIDAGVQFDMTADGILDDTSWVGADDGLLALDINGDGTINDHSELFGTNMGAADGFAQLALFDSNEDGVIDASDDVFANLLVWQDANQDGVSQADELYSLSDLDIVSINLGAAETGYELGGSYVSHDSTYTLADGSENAIVDAWFNVEVGSNAIENVVDFGGSVEQDAINEFVSGTEADNVVEFTGAEATASTAFANDAGLAPVDEINKAAVI